MRIRPKRIRGIIFDYDGPLALSFAEGIRLLLGVARAKGLVFDPRAVVKCLIRDWGRKGDQLLSRAFDIPIEEAVLLYREWSALEKTTPYALSPDAERTLRLLKEAGVVLTILTSRPKDSFHLSFDQMGIAQYFSHIVTTCDAEFHKPHERSFDCTMELMASHDIPENECGFVGDTFVDIDAMRNRKLLGFIVQTGPYGYVTQKPFGKARIIKSTSELIPRIEMLGYTLGHAA